MCHSKGTSDRFYVAELSVGEVHSAQSPLEDALGISVTSIEQPGGPRGKERPIVFG